MPETFKRRIFSLDIYRYRDIAKCEVIVHSAMWEKVENTYQWALSLRVTMDSGESSFRGYEHFRNTWTRKKVRALLRQNSHREAYRKAMLRILAGLPSLIRSSMPSSDRKEGSLDKPILHFLFEQR